MEKVRESYLYCAFSPWLLTWLSIDVIANLLGTRRPFKGRQDLDQVLFDCPVVCRNVWKFQGGGFEVSGKMFRGVPKKTILKTWSGGGPQV